MSHAEIQKLEADVAALNLCAISGEMLACMQAPECTDSSAGSSGGGYC